MINDIFIPETPHPDEIDWEELKCPKHPKMPIIYFCLSNKCKNNFICKSCNLEEHNEHKSDLLDFNTNNKMYSEIIKNLPNIREFVEKRLLKKIEGKFEELKRIFSDIIENHKKQMISYLKEYRDFKYIENIKNSFHNIVDNYNNNNKDVEINESYLINNIRIMLKEYNSEKKDLFEKKCLNSIDENIKEIKKGIENIKNLNFDHYFEFSKYSTTKYFSYTLEECDTKVIKKDNSGLSVCRTLMPMEKGQKYEIEFIPEINKEGEIQVGFGPEDALTKKTLECENTYGLSTKGIIINTEIKNNKVTLVDKRKVGFVVDLINWKFDFIDDDEQLFSYKLVPDIEYYPMVAIENEKNSVKLLSKILKN